MALLTHGEYTVTASAARLVSQSDASRAVGSVALTALSTNSGTVYVGGPGVTTANGYPLGPGDTFSCDFGDASSIYIIGTASDKVRWIATDRSLPS